MKKALTILECKEGDVRVHTTFSALQDPAGLLPHPDNNNLHSAEQIKIMKAVLKSSGWRQNVIVSEKTGHIVSGHLRVITAIEMGLKKVPVDIQHFDTRLDEVRHLTADNELARMATFDVPKFLETKDDFQKTMDTNHFQTCFFNPNDWGLSGYPKEEEEKTKASPQTSLPLLKDGDKWNLGSHVLVIGEVADYQEGYLQRFLKGWKKIQQVEAFHNKTKQSFSEVMTERKEKLNDA